MKENVQVVTTEAEFNNAINMVNQNQCSMIDIQASFTLTNDTNKITNSVGIMSSNSSRITDGGYAVLHISKGAQVTFSVNAGGGSGTCVIDGSGEDSALIGKTGGAIANLMIQNDGVLVIEQPDMFSTSAININPISGMRIRGILLNSGPITVTESIIQAGPVQKSSYSAKLMGKDNFQLAAPCFGALNLSYESYLMIASGITLLAGKTTVYPMCYISSDGTGSIWSKDKIDVMGSVMHASGMIQGVNVHYVELFNGGIFCGALNADGSAVFNNGKADRIQNTSGVFDMGISGNCTVGEYVQTGGTLQFEIPNFTGVASFLNISKSAEITGGKFLISSGLYFVPDGTTSQTIKLITAPNPDVLNKLSSMVQFSSFPSGITPSVSVTGNTLNLVLTV